MGTGVAVATDDTITAAKTNLKLETVDTVDITASAITTSKIAAGTITTDSVKDAAITNAKVAADAITTSKIVAGTITTDRVADAAVTEAKMASIPQVGSKASGVYWTYPVAYSAAPTGAAATPLNAFVQDVYPISISRLVAGSLIAVGSPAGWLYAVVYGNK